MAPGDARIPAEAGGRRTADGTDLGDRAIWDSPRAAPGRMDRGRRPGCPDAAHVRSSRLGEGRMPGPASTGGRGPGVAGPSGGNGPVPPEAKGQPFTSAQTRTEGRGAAPGIHQRLPNTGATLRGSEGLNSVPTGLSARSVHVPVRLPYTWSNQPSHWIADFCRHVLGVFKLPVIAKFP